MILVYPLLETIFNPWNGTFFFDPKNKPSVIGASDSASLTRMITVVILNALQECPARSITYECFHRLLKCFASMNNAVLLQLQKKVTEVFFH